MFLANRNDEIFVRAKNREVVALINIFAPGVDPNADMSHFGTIIKEKKRYLPGLTSSVFSQAAHIWQFDDTCVPLVEKDTKVCLEIQEALRVRTRKLNSGELNHLASDEKAVLFESRDLMAKATGIPKLSLTFTDSNEQTALSISTVPFKMLKSYLLALHEKLQAISGKVESVTIAHSDSLSAHDYYKIAQAKYREGRTAHFEDLRQQRANKALDILGVPKYDPMTKKLN